MSNSEPPTTHQQVISQLRLDDLHPPSSARMLGEIGRRFLHGSNLEIWKLGYRAGVQRALKLLNGVKENGTSA